MKTTRFKDIPLELYPLAQIKILPTMLARDCLPYYSFLRNLFSTLPSDDESEFFLLLSHKTLVEFFFWTTTKQIPDDSLRKRKALTG